MRPTNYRKGAHHGKAISNGVDSAIMDIERLKKYITPTAHRLALFAFYPLYPENYGIFNNLHLSRLSKAVGKDIVSPSRKVMV